MEREFKIPIPNTELNIYAKQYGPLDRPVVVFVHGLTGFMDEHQFYNGARYFYEKGFSSVRFNLYDFDDDARKLVDCTLQTHAQDVDTVVDYLKQKNVNKICAVGHSYGAPSIILSSQKHLDGMILWDGTHTFSFLNEAKQINGENLYLLNWAASFVIGKEMYEEANQLHWDDVITKIKVPVQFIWAGNGVLVEKGKELFEKVSQPKSYAIVKSAGHTFSEEGTAEKLYDESISWLKKFV